MKKAILTIGLVLLLLIAAAVWYYRAIQSDFYAANERAMKRAVAETVMTRADHVDYFAGEREYRIVYGVNENNEKLIVWIGGGEVHEEKAADGAGRDEIRSRIRKLHGDVHLIRLVPGKLGDEYVWEAFFKKDESDGTRHYYDYYRFKDGEWLDTLRLNAE